MEKTCEHLFIECPFAKDCWNLLGILMRTSLRHIQAKKRRRFSMGVQFIFLMAEAQSKSNSSSSLSWVPGPVCLKLVTHDASGLHF